MDWRLVWCNQSNFIKKKMFNTLWWPIDSEMYLLWKLFYYTGQISPKKVLKKIYAASFEASCIRSIKAGLFMVYPGL